VATRSSDWEVVLFYVLLAVHILFAVVDDGSAAEEAAFQARMESNCRLLSEAAQTVAKHRGRADLLEDADGQPPCMRIVWEGCEYQVELQAELLAAGMTITSAKIGEAFPHCEADLAFAMKHGIAAYRDAQRL
jgi:hypothetical protein